MNGKSKYFPIPHHQRQEVLQGFRQLHRPDFTTSRQISNGARQCQGAVIGALKGSTVSSRPASILEPVLQPAKLSDFPTHMSAFHLVESEAFNPRRCTLFLK